MHIVGSLCFSEHKLIMYTKRVLSSKRRKDILSAFRLLLSLALQSKNQRSLHTPEKETWKDVAHRLGLFLEPRYLGLRKVNKIRAFGFLVLIVRLSCSVDGDTG